MNNDLLKSTQVPWPSPDPVIRAALSVPPEDLPKFALVALVKELDRRHMQLQDKVAFEREHNLVDYSSLFKKPDHPGHQYGVAMPMLVVELDKKFGPYQQHFVTVDKHTEIRVKNWPTDFDPKHPPTIDLFIKLEPTGVIKYDSETLWLGGMLPPPFEPHTTNMVRYKPVRENGKVYTTAEVAVLNLK